MNVNSVLVTEISILSANLHGVTSQITTICTRLNICIGEND